MAYRNYCAINWTIEEICPEMFNVFESADNRNLCEFFPLVESNFELFKCWFNMFRHRLEDMRYQVISSDLKIYEHVIDISPVLVFNESLLYNAITSGDMDVYEYFEQRVTIEQLKTYIGNLGNFNIFVINHNSMLRQIYNSRFLYIIQLLDVSVTLECLNYDISAYQILYSCQKFTNFTVHELVELFLKCKEAMFLIDLIIDNNDELSTEELIRLFFDCREATKLIDVVIARDVKLDEANMIEIFGLDDWSYLKDLNPFFIP